MGYNIKTIGQRFKDQGLKTAYIGKWHLEGWDTEYWYDMRNYLEELNPDERVISRESSSIDNLKIEEEFCYAHRWTERGLSYIDQNRDEDFMLVLSYDEPHHPFLAPRKYSEMYKDYSFPKNPNVMDSLEGKPDYQKVWAGDNLNEDKESLEIKKDKFFGFNTFVDEQIGRILDSLKENCPDAMIIYTSDHGDFLESHSLSSKGPAVYEEVCRVPLIIHFPDMESESIRYNHPVSHINIAPTILEFMGLSLPQILEGTSLIPLLENPEAKINEEIYIEFGRFEIDHDNFGAFQPLRCAFDGRYKLSINLLSTDERYDLSEDPSEMVNLIDHPEAADVRDHLHDRILNWMNETRDPFRGYYWHDRPWRRDAPGKTWNYTGYTRQREHEEYEPRQLDYDTGLEIKESNRKTC